MRVVADEYAAELAALPPGTEPSPALREIRWMIEELRVASTRTRCAPATRSRSSGSSGRIDELPR